MENEKELFYKMSIATISRIYWEYIYKQDRICPTLESYLRDVAPDLAAKVFEDDPKESGE